MSKSYEDMSIEELIEQTRDRKISLRSKEMGDLSLEIENRRAARDAILDLAESLESEGLVVVPIKPTKEMLWAPWWGDEGMKEICEIVWEDMIAASPLPSPCESKGG